MIHIPPIGPVAPPSQTAPSAALSAASAQATRAQSQITGAQSNYGVQADMQARKDNEVRKRRAQKMIGGGPAVGSIGALGALPDMRRDHGDDEDDHSSAGQGLIGRRQKKRKPIVPPL